MNLLLTYLSYIYFYYLYMWKKINDLPNLKTYMRSF